MVESAQPNVNFGAPGALQISDNWKNGGRTSNPETLTLVKFKIPVLPKDQDASLFKYRLRLYGGKVETNGADQIFFYPASNDWSAASVTWKHRPTCSYNSDGQLYLNSSREYRMVDIDKAVRKALAEGKTEISWYIGGDRQGNHYQFDAAAAQKQPILMLVGFKTTPEI